MNLFFGLLKLRLSISSRWWTRISTYSMRSPLPKVLKTCPSCVHMQTWSSSWVKVFSRNGSEWWVKISWTWDTRSLAEGPNNSLSKGRREMCTKIVGRSGWFWSTQCYRFIMLWLRSLRKSRIRCWFLHQRTTGSFILSIWKTGK